MTNSIDIFIPYINNKQWDSCIQEFKEKNNIHSIHKLNKSCYSTNTLLEISNTAKSQYIIICLKSTPLRLGYKAIDRFINLANKNKTGLLYANHYKIKNNKKQNSPLIEYQFGSIRDDFDFGSLLFFDTQAFQSATSNMFEEYHFAGLYDLILHIKDKYLITHIPEYLYTEVEDDLRDSSEKQFDYVDPRNRERQIEMEKVCTHYLSKINALVNQQKQKLNFNDNAFDIEASVIIPVRNRENTIIDAIKSALNQKTTFKYNIIIVDNHSTDQTTEKIKSLPKNNKIIHLIPNRDDLGIGGCWNYAINSKYCGKFSIQLDSDDLYKDENTLQKIVDLFYKEHCAMVIGSYLMTDFELNEIPPGIIDHKEWTNKNGANNALRINGLGAPRAFFTPLLRKLNLPNTNYGEDYAIGLRLSREYKISRIYEPIYLCRRWKGNSDATLTPEQVNANNKYKDYIRTIELLARKKD